MESEHRGTFGSRFWKAVPERTLVIPKGLHVLLGAAQVPLEISHLTAGSERDVLVQTTCSWEVAEGGLGWGPGPV